MGKLLEKFKILNVDFVYVLYILVFLQQMSVAMILHVLDYIVFVIFCINTVYLLFYSIASCFKKKEVNSTFTNYRKIAVLIPAYREDEVIKECVESCLKQDYPQDRYDIIVISDHMKDSTNQALESMAIQLVIVDFENSTKAKALNLAMSRYDNYDIAIVLDADNTIGTDFLQKNNKAFADGTMHVYQSHRIAKNLNTNLALLDAVSEEINNSIFRQGHVNVGMSAALIGSGMAFKYGLLKEKLARIPAVGGFDRALELTLFKERFKIGYLPDAWVLDEKIQTHSDFSRQRRRWMSAQLHYFCEFVKDVPHAICTCNLDFCDKMFQQMSIPRLILVGLNLIIAGTLSLVSWSLSIKWWILLLFLLIALFIAVPRRFLTLRFLLAAVELPMSFILMFFNLFRMKGANKKFIHTKHGVK